MNDCLFLASVIIPAYGRVDSLDRAIQSIKRCNGAKNVEIIVVDDCSPIPITWDFLQENDRVIRLDNNSGAAIARNVGIENARGQLIYLLDNDDYIVERDFESDARAYADTGALYYSQIESQNYRSDYPSELEEADFFDAIFFRYPHIAQTSSLFFDRNVSIRFDESLPKHQDWDLVLFGAIKKGIPVKHGSGKIFFDRGDKNSLSRAYHGHKSEVWYKKIVRAYGTDVKQNKSLVTYYLFSQYLTHTSWWSFSKESVKLIVSRQLPVITLIKKTVHRLLQVKQQLIKAEK
jgi:glycosyltransferase involved in cell wall biosynthesis